MLHIDPKVLKAMQLAGEEIMKSYHKARKEQAQYTYGKGGWVRATYPPFANGGYVYGMDFDKAYYDDPDPEHLNPEGTIIIDMKDNHCIPFYQKSFKSDLTTAQKMRAFKFIIALETAKEL